MQPSRSYNQPIQRPPRRMARNRRDAAGGTEESTARASICRRGIEPRDELPSCEPPPHVEFPAKGGMTSRSRQVRPQYLHVALLEQPLEHWPKRAQVVRPIPMQIRLPHQFFARRCTVAREPSDYEAASAKRIEAMLGHREAQAQIAGFLAELARRRDALRVIDC